MTSRFTLFPQPSGAQSLRLWQKLWSLRRGSLAVPAEKDSVGPRFPSGRTDQVLLKASAIRAARAGGIPSLSLLNPLKSRITSTGGGVGPSRENPEKIFPQAHRAKPTPCPFPTLDLAASQIILVSLSSRCVWNAPFGFLTFSVRRLSVHRREVILQVERRWNS